MSKVQNRNTSSTRTTTTTTTTRTTKTTTSSTSNNRNQTQNRGGSRTNTRKPKQTLEQILDLNQIKEEETINMMTMILKELLMTM